MSHLFTVDNADNRQHRAHTFLESIFIKKEPWDSDGFDIVVNLGWPVYALNPPKHLGMVRTPPPLLQEVLPDHLPHLPV